MSKSVPDVFKIYENISFFRYLYMCPLTNSPSQRICYRLCQYLEVTRGCVMELNSIYETLCNKRLVF